MTVPAKGSLIIGGIEIPIHAISPLNQNYQEFGGFSTRRMLSGRARKQTNWEKLSTQISAGGTIPAGLGTLDYKNPMVISCASARSLRGPSNVFTLPASRRSDPGFEPYGRGLVGYDWVCVDVGLVGDTATVTPVAGASQYEVLYYPEFTATVDPPQEQEGVDSKNFTWTLIAEEV